MAVLLLAGLLIFNTTRSTRAGDHPLAWPKITSQTRPWAFWWWMGSAVDKTNLTKELTRYQAAGLGGVHIIPIYGAKGWEQQYIPYLSPGWMEMMGWSVSEAHRLGMGVDMTTGTGWCFGGPQVTDQDANASVIVKTYPVAAGQKLGQKFNRQSTQALVAYGPDGQVVELTDKISKNGEAAFAPAAGDWTVYAITQKPSGQKVKRAAPGGAGWMLNLIYPPAMDDYLKPFTAAFANYHGPKPRAQFQDSYEYRSDWSPDFFAEFQKRRGYRLQTELPALFGTNEDNHSARVKCDYRRTVSEIMAQESLPAWVNWSHQHGFLTRDQAHGSPGNWLDLYADADIPETEMFHLDRNILISKFASSAAHVAGHPLTSAETGTWLEEHFTVTLGDLKSLADDMFLAGVNHIFYHGLCYSPDEAGYPGWHFYASTEMNPRNSIWHDVPALNEYIARCQSVLQSGKPDNDILLYWPIEDFWMQPGQQLLPQLTVHARDWFEHQSIGQTANDLWNAGGSFDYASDAQLQKAHVIGGKVVVPGGQYQVIVVPACKYIPLETMKRLVILAINGATVIFDRQLPEDVAGLAQLANRRAVFHNLAGAIKSAAADGGVIGQGHVLIADLGSGLAAANVPAEPMVNDGFSFIRRSFAGGWYYFIANRTPTNFDGWITLARPAKSIVAMDPMSGLVGVAATRLNAANRLQVHMQLAAGQSLILRAWAGQKTVKGPAWVYRETAGRPQTISGDWQVSFVAGGPTLPARFQTDRLASWTTFPDAGVQAFAGTARYEIKFDLQEASFATRHASFVLDLGDVRQSARVTLNGKDYGTLIASPFRVTVDHLKPTGNVLEVEVTSVAANRIRDLDRRGVKWKTFHDINIVDINYKPFDASHWPLTDCGLLGPVTLTPVTAE
jgi:hypothetical protein